MNSIMTSDESSEVLSKMNKCIRRIVCHGRHVLAVLQTGLAKSAIHHLISKVLFRLGCTANVTSKTTAELLVFLLAYKVERCLHQVPVLKLTHYETNTEEDVFYKINHIFVGRTVQHCMLIHAVRAWCNSHTRSDFR